MKPKSNLKWLLIVLAAVIIGAGLYYYFGIFKGSKTVVTVSPSPIAFKSPSVSPSKSSTPTGGQTATSQPTSQTSPTKSGEFGPVAGKECVPHVSFNYPDNYSLNIFGGTPSSAGYVDLSANTKEIRIDAPEWISTGHWETPCVSYSNIEDAYTQLSRYSPATAGPTYLTINGYQAVKWSSATSKFVVLKNGDQYIEVDANSGTPENDFNTVVNSLKFL